MFVFHKETPKSASTLEVICTNMVIMEHREWMIFNSFKVVAKWCRGWLRLSMMGNSLLMVLFYFISLKVSNFLPITEPAFLISWVCWSHQVWCCSLHTVLTTSVNLNHCVAHTEGSQLTWETEPARSPFVHSFCVRLSVHSAVSEVLVHLCHMNILSLDMLLAFSLWSWSLFLQSYVQKQMITSRSFLKIILSKLAASQIKHESWYELTIYKTFNTLTNK